jgi:uncharacterized protein YceK
MKKLFLFIPITVLLLACGSVNNQESSPEEEASEYEVSEETYTEEEEQQTQGIEDGRHSATVYYNNSETGHSATYTLDVEVENNEVTTIYFESGGFLDSDHIQPAELDESGNATIYGEGGKTYDVQIN